MTDRDDALGARARRQTLAEFAHEQASRRGALEALGAKVLEILKADPKARACGFDKIQGMASDLGLLDEERT